MKSQMTPKTRSKDDSTKQNRGPFLLIFPWAKAFGLLFLFVFVLLFVYRVSSTGGHDIEQSCFAAIIVSAVPGLVSFFVVANSWGKDAHGVLVSAILAFVIRLLTAGAGIAIITIFTGINRSWFVGFLGFYYLAFLGIDICFTLWMLRNSDLKEQKEMIHGNLWDAFS